MDRTISAQELKKLLDTEKGLVLLDVRRKTDRDADPAALPGALWRDPDNAASWSSELPPGRDVVIYCAHGGSVSNKVLDQLLEKKIPARFIEGGIAAWKESGGRIVEKKT